VEPDRKAQLVAMIRRDKPTPGASGQIARPMSLAQRSSPGGAARLFRGPAVAATSHNSAISDSARDGSTSVRILAGFSEPVPRAKRLVMRRNRKMARRDIARRSSIRCDEDKAKKELCLMIHPRPRALPLDDCVSLTQSLLERTVEVAATLVEGPKG